MNTDSNQETEINQGFEQWWSENYQGILRQVTMNTDSNQETEINQEFEQWWSENYQGILGAQRGLSVIEQAFKEIALAAYRSGYLAGAYEHRDH